MAYSIHIERREPIDRDAWVEAVADTDGVRLASGDRSAVNPATGDVITIKGDGSDAEIYLADEDRWMPVFFWCPRGQVSFDAAAFEIDGAPVEQVARTLASKLGALLIGDEGESYD